MKPFRPTTWLLLPFLIGQVGNLRAQCLTIEPGTNDPMELVFNPEFVARNGIRAMHGTTSLKRDNEPIRKREQRTSYRFGSHGLTTYSNTSFGNPGSGVDTASVVYIYDSKGRLEEQFRNDIGGHFKLRHERDAEGRSIRQTYMRVENTGPDRYRFIPGPTTNVSDERYTHATVSDSVQLITFLNDRGLPYREQRWTRDKLGYVRSIEDRYLITGRRGSIRFSYDEKGRVSERIEQADLSRDAKIRHSWTYDRAGNPLTCDRWNNDRHVRHTEYVYDERSMVLKAVLARDLETGIIHIVQYTVER